MTPATAAQARSFWPQTPASAPTAPPRPAPEPETEAEGPGEQTQALAYILSALGNMGEVQRDEGDGGGGEREAGPGLSGQDVLRLLEVETKGAIRDEADAWARALPPHDVLFLAPTTHEVYRARAAHLIQTERAPRPPVTETARERRLPQDSLLRDQIIRSRFSVEEHRAKTHRRIVQ